METTSISLIEKLQGYAARNTAEHKRSQLAESSEDAWDRFVQLYGPAVDLWVRKLGLNPDDAADMVQDIFTKVFQAIVSLDYDPQRRFRGWLYRITKNHCIDWLRKKSRSPSDLHSGIVNTLVASDESEFWETDEIKTLLLTRALHIMKSEYDETQWKACWEATVSGKPARQIARELGITANSVYLAKSRILSRLRQEFAGFLAE